MAVTAWSGSADAQTGDTFLSEINRLRQAGGVTCAEMTYSDPVDPAIQMGPAPALVRNRMLDQAAQAYAAAVAQVTAGIQQEPQFVGPTGYLPWRAGSGHTKERTIDEVALAGELDASSNALGCRAVLSGDYSEIGIATAQANGWTTFLYVVAEPFRRELIPEYAREIFDDLNAVRAQGVSCFGQNYPPMPPLSWSDGLAQAAQGHSEDMASNPGWGSDPHSGSNGSRPADRVAAVPCEARGVAENVAANSPEPPARAWTEMSLGHCANVMRDATHAGVGIATATPIASTTWGRHPFVTLNVATVTGACGTATAGPAPGDPVQPTDPGASPTSPTNPAAPTHGQLKPGVFYRITSVETGQALDIAPSDARSRHEKIKLAEQTDYIGQKWMFETANSDGYVMMSPDLRGGNTFMTINRGYPPLFLLHRAGAQPKQMQHWRFEAVEGMADTYRIRNEAFKNVMLAAGSGGQAIYVDRPAPDDRTALWKVEPF